MTPQADSPYCFAHDPDPEVAARREEARIRGGKAGRPEPLNVDVDLSSLAGIQEALSTAASALLRRRLNEKDARALTALADTALKVLESQNEGQDFDELVALLKDKGLL